MALFAATRSRGHLGARGHVVVLREGTLDFIHAHPITSATEFSGRVDFAVTFPIEGKYKLFSQFQHQGRVLAEAGQLRGELRFTHLKYHLAMRRLLTPEQVTAYDTERGYAAPAGSHQGHAGGAKHQH